MITAEDHDAAARMSWLHVVWNATPATVESVLEHGLERERSNYVGYLESRPGHVYIGRPDRVKAIFFGKAGFAAETAYVNGRGYADWAVFRVDVAQLMPARVNADEDHFTLYGGPSGGLDVLRRFKLDLPPCGWAWSWAKYLKIRPPASLGEWADAMKLGADPAQTRHSIRHGSLAIEGVVPPSALRLIATSPAVRVEA